MSYKDHCKDITNSSCESKKSYTTFESDQKCATESDILSSECIVSSEFSKILQSSSKCKNDKKSEKACKSSSKHNYSDKDNCEKESYFKKDICKILKMIKCLNNEIKCIKSYQNNGNNNCCDNNSSCDNVNLDHNIKKYIDYKISCAMDNVVEMIDDKLSKIDKTIDNIKKTIYQNK